MERSTQEINCIVVDIQNSLGFGPEATVYSLNSTGCVDNSTVVKRNGPRNILIERWYTTFRASPR